MKCDECPTLIYRGYKEACYIARKPYKRGCQTSPGRIEQELRYHISIQRGKPWPDGLIFAHGEPK